MNKLHHVSKKKKSARGQGAYSADEQPLKGGGEMAQSKKVGGLATHSLMSAGAYNVIRENSTLRGAENHEFWKNLRSGRMTRRPGKPFVWQKFKALLVGSGMQARDVGQGRLRLTPFTDKDLPKDAIEIENGDMMDPRTLQPIRGGLFDSRLLSKTDAWGKITLPEPVINPAYEDGVRNLLGLSKKELNAIMRGEAELPEHLR